MKGLKSEPSPWPDGNSGKAHTFILSDKTPSHSEITTHYIPTNYNLKINLRRLISRSAPNDFSFYAKRFSVWRTMKMRLQVLLQTERRYRATTTGNNPKGDAPVQPEASPTLPLIPRRERTAYCISITRFTFAFSSGVRFGSVMFNTPSLTFALILSFSTSSGKTRACWNLA